MSRRSIACLGAALVLILGHDGAVDAAPVILIVPKLEAGAGTETEVPIVVKGAKGMSALQMRLTYDPAVLEVVTSPDDADKCRTAGKILPKKATAKVFTTTPGKLPIFFLGGVDAGSKELYAIEEDGTLMTIRFKVLGQAGQKTALSLEKAEAFQQNDMDLVVRTEAGEMTITRSFPWVWLCVAVLVVLLLLGLIAFFVLRRRQSNPYDEKVASSIPAARPKGTTKPCPRCGNPVQKGSAFCSSCGAKFVQKPK